MKDHIPILPTRHHNLMQWSQPVIFIQRALRVYPNEVKLLLWVTTIQLVMSSSAIQINNFAQSAFLKRFGVKSLPTVFMAEAVITLIFSGFVGILMERYRNVRVFTGLLLYFAVLIGVIRLLLPTEIIWLYPALYIIKSQSVALLPLLYWDIQADLFTTQQSKRLFTLITAGGVLGTTVGSLMTARLARWFGLNNLLVIFIGGMVLAAVLNELTEKIVKTPIETRIDRRKGKIEGQFIDHLREFVTQARQSTLLKYMIIIIAIPNILLPVLDYQFNVVVDGHFTTEAATLGFFGLFRGISNAAMFGILMVSGRVITRLGVANSLLFHPANYFLAFGVLFSQFGIVSGVYARFSTEVFKTTLNNPARAVLYNFFPEKSRALIRVFLRGVVVRISDFTGSGFLILIKGLVDPRWLSLVAAPLALIWLFTTFRFKKAYASILIQTLADRHMDWGRVEDLGLQALIKDKGLLGELKQKIVSAEPETAAFYGEILATAKPPGWAEAVIGALSAHPPETQKQMLNLFGPEDAAAVVEPLLQMIPSASPNVLPHLLKTIVRLDPRKCPSVSEAFLDHPDRRVRTEALVCIYLDPSQHSKTLFRHRLENLLHGSAFDVRMGIEILGKTGEPAFADTLLQHAAGDDPDLRAWAISGLTKMDHPGAAEIARTAIADACSTVRKAALESLGELKDGLPVHLLVNLLGDPDPTIRARAAVEIRKREKESIHALLAGLHSPSSILKKELPALLKHIGVPGATLSAFLVNELSAAYGCLAKVQVLENGDLSPALTLCRDHLLETCDNTIEVVLRVLGTTVFEDRMKLIIRAIQSKEKRDVENAIEALESVLHSHIRHLLVPLLGDRSISEKLAAGRERLESELFTAASLKEVLKEIVNDPDPMIQSIGLYALGEMDRDDSLMSDIRKHTDSENRWVRQAAAWALDAGRSDTPTGDRPADSSTLLETTLWLRRISIFTDLRVLALLTIAAMMELKRYVRDEIVFREGMPYDRFYLVYTGRVSLIMGADTAQTKLLDCIAANRFFGELSLIDRQHQPYTVKVDAAALIYTLKADDFLRVLKDYPSVSLNLCKVFIQRMRDYQGRLVSAPSDDPAG